METRTQWELAGVTIAITIAAGSYTIGKSASDDTVKQLEKSLFSYEKSDKLNTEEFIDSAIEVHNDLKLSIAERNEFHAQKKYITTLKEQEKENNKKYVALEVKALSLEDNLSKIEGNYEIKIKKIRDSNKANLRDKELNNSKLITKLERYESSNYSFTLKKGEGINLKNGLIQVGYSQVEYDKNICDVSINNKHKQMKAGDFVSVDTCKVTLTKCIYNKPSDFELVCQ